MYINIYIYIYKLIHLSLSLYLSPSLSLYIYIYREREREGGTFEGLHLDRAPLLGLPAGRDPAAAPVRLEPVRSLL